MNLTAVLYKHDNNLINSILVVDNFGMKYENRSNVVHLWYVLKKLYSNYILVRKIPHRNIFYLGLLQHPFLPENYRTTLGLFEKDTTPNTNAATIYYVPMEISDLQMQKSTD